MSLEDPSPCPYLTPSLKGVGGAIRLVPEDFEVEEIPAYLPSGEGTHLYVFFQKRQLTTQQATRAIAKTLDVNPKGVGWAGLKDKYAVTRQWASFADADPSKLEALMGIEQKWGADEAQGLQILEAKLHGNKLRVGHLKGNRFNILIQNLDPGGEPERVLERLAAEGVPNYFGAQRFGRDNLRLARQWLVEGGKPPRDRFLRKMLPSALQSELFNRLLSKRVIDKQLSQALEGDLYRKEDSGGLFTTEDMDDASMRLADWEISPTGPMFGPKMQWPADPRENIERAVLEASGVALERLGKFAPGTRRPVRVRLSDCEMTREPSGLRLRFTLPKGAYATTVLREIQKSKTDKLAPEAAG